MLLHYNRIFKIKQLELLILPFISTSMLNMLTFPSGLDCSFSVVPSVFEMKCIHVVVSQEFMVDGKPCM